MKTTATISFTLAGLVLIAIVAVILAPDPVMGMFQSSVLPTPGEWYDDCPKDQDCALTPLPTLTSLPTLTPLPTLTQVAIPECRETVICELPTQQPYATQVAFSTQVPYPTATAYPPQP